MSIKVNTQSIDQWINNQANREVAARQAMIVSKDETIKKVQKVIDKHNTTGQLKGSVIGIASSRGYDIYSAGYGDIVLEYGRKPGRMPPVSALEGWAEQKLGDKRLAYIVARNIAQRGTKKHQRGGPKELSWILNWISREFWPKQASKLLDAYTK